MGDVKSKTPVDKLKEEPRTCCFYLRYTVISLRYYVVIGSKAIASNPLFEILCMLLICVNCALLAFDDPMDDGIPKWLRWSNIGFQIVYTIELLIRILAYGLIVPEGAFLRNVWNIFDLIVVVLGYLDFFELDDPDFDPRPLRIIRVFRSFQSITGIEGVKAIMVVLSTSFTLLFYVGLIYFFYLVIFSIVGLQLWHGSLNYRCMNEITHEYLTDMLCGRKSCPAGYICVKYYDSISYNIINFDSFLSSLLVSFIVSTDEGGPKVQKALIEVEGYYVTIYFTLILVIGCYFLKHFILGVFQYNINLLYAGNRAAIETKDPLVTGTPASKYKTLRPSHSFSLDPEFGSLLNRN